MILESHAIRIAVLFKIYVLWVIYLYRVLKGGFIQIHNMCKKKLKKIKNKQTFK
jgi:hypothetical protein